MSDTFIHGLNGYVTYKCRCSVCKEEKAKSWRKYANKKGIKPKVPYTPRHGTVSEYRNHNCRCEACRKANTEYQAKLRNDTTKALQDNK